MANYKGPPGSALGGFVSPGSGPIPGAHSGVFRVGESPLWASWTFSGQQVEGVVFPFDEEKFRSMAKEIYAVSWEIYTEDKNDLLHLMWNGELEWDFIQTVIPIGPLSMFNGSFFDMFFSQGSPSELEELASVKAESEWREMCQSFLIGKTHFFRGLARYQQNPILIPGDASWKVHLKFREPFQPKGDTRMRVILNGRWKSPIQVG